MRWVSAISQAESTDAALFEIISLVRGQLGAERPDLLLAFVSNHHEPAYAAVSRGLNSAFSGALLLGCSAGAVIGGGTEVEGSPGLSVTAAVLPGVDIHPFHLVAGDMPSLEAEPGTWATAFGLQRMPPPCIMVIPDPHTTPTEVLVRGMDAAFPGSPKIGGIASGGHSAGANALFLGDRLHRAGAVGVALSGNITLDTVVAQGCRPVGSPMIVTRCEGNLILELDGQPPLAALQNLFEQLDEADRELFRTAPLCGVEMRDTVEHREGEYLIRNVLGIRDEGDGMFVGEVLRLWQVVQFHVRDARTSHDDVHAALSRYAQEARDRLPEGAVLFSCLGRGKGLYGHPNHDSDALREHLGEIPLGGFFCSGEIGPVQGITYLHGYTSAFGLFRSARPPSFVLDVGGIIGLLVVPIGQLHSRTGNSP
ncbi:MAG: FIST C-terminal domain-containing protein [Deltaproteobacteria bacterium]|nr:FIST C-terminal domain-containing protein [Deltaproteobacteria bacterium]